MTPPAGRPSSSSTKRWLGGTSPPPSPSVDVSTSKGARGTYLARGRRCCRRCQADSARRSAVSRHLSSPRTKPGGVLLACCSQLGRSGDSRRIAPPRHSGGRSGRGCRHHHAHPATDCGVVRGRAPLRDTAGRRFGGRASARRLRCVRGDVHAVAQRTHDSACACRRRHAFADPLAHPGLCGAAHDFGLLIGTAAGIIVVAMISTLLFNAGPADAIVFLAAPALLLLVALTATSGPARRQRHRSSRWLRRGRRARDRPTTDK